MTVLEMVKKILLTDFLYKSLLINFLCGSVLRMITVLAFNGHIAII